MASFENKELLMNGYLTDREKILHFPVKSAKILQWDVGCCGSQVLIEAVMIILTGANNQTSCSVKMGM